MQLTWGDRRWGPDDVEESIDAATLALGRLGVRAGHRVASLAANTPLAVFLQAATQRLEATFVPIHRRVPEAAMAAQLRRAGAHVAVTDDSELAKRLRPPIPVLRATARGDRWDTLRPLDLPRPTTDGQGPAAIVHTSGTTGTPRAIALPRTALDAHAAASADRLQSGDQDVWLGVLPLYHVGGLTLVDRCLRLEAHLVLHDRFNVDAVRAALHRASVTHASLVPTMLHRLLASDQAAAPPALRCLLVGGDRTPAATVATALERGWPLHTTYGLTEACGQVATARPEELHDRHTTSGRPLGGVTVRIVDADGAPLGPGATGQILVDGPTIGHDLHHRRTGALSTGDQGHLDADGFLHVMGRRTDLVVTGGVNVDPLEVEAVLRDHSHVVEACVVGMDHPEWGAVVAAALVVAPGQAPTVAELEAHCRQRLGPAQVPRRYLILKRLPKTPMGKTDVAMVRTWLTRQPGATMPR